MMSFRITFEEEPNGADEGVNCDGKLSSECPLLSQGQ